MEIKNIPSGLYHRISKVALHSVYYANLESIFFSVKCNSNVILMYHGIDREGRKDYNYRFCGINDFKKQVKYFKKHFDIVPLSEFSFIKGGKGKRKMAITFDDGYKNNYKYAFPIIEKEGIPTTFFVTSLLDTGYKTLWADAVDIYSFYLKEFSYNGLKFIKDPIRNRLYNKEKNIFLNPYVKSLSFNEKMLVVKQLSGSTNMDIEQMHQFDDYRQLMNEEEIKEVSRSKYVTIGSHSHLHSNLGDIRISDSVKELRHSKDYLERITGREINSLAYPDGSYTREMIDEAYKMGFTIQLACNYLFEKDADDSRILKRLGLYSDISCIEQIHKVNTYL